SFRACIPSGQSRRALGRRASPSCTTGAAGRRHWFLGRWCEHLGAGFSQLRGLAPERRARPRYLAGFLPLTRWTVAREDRPQTPRRQSYLARTLLFVWFPLCLVSGDL